jgi:hypothetical protein
MMSLSNIMEEGDLLEHKEMMGMIECGDEEGLLLSQLDSGLGKLEKDKVNDQSNGTLL